MLIRQTQGTHVSSNIQKRDNLDKNQLEDDIFKLAYHFCGSYSAVEHICNDIFYIYNFFYLNPYKLFLWYREQYQYLKL
jgi:hypothetical protein